MNYWRINIDKDERDDYRTCDLWYKFGMAFAGDFSGNKGNHDAIFRKVCPGDGIFMHHSVLAIVGYGIVKDIWDGVSYELNERLLYVKEKYEYRIAVDWDSDYDCRENPLPIKGCLPYVATYSYVDT